MTVEQMKNDILKNPERIKWRMARELGASIAYSLKDNIYLKIDKISWENMNVELNDIQMFLSKETLLGMFDDDEDIVIGKMMISFKKEEVIISSDFLKIVDPVEGDTYFYGFSLEMSRKTYSEIDNLMAI